MAAGAPGMSYKFRIVENNEKDICELQIKSWFGWKTIDSCPLYSFAVEHLEKRAANYRKGHRVIKKFN